MVEALPETASGRSIVQSCLTSFGFSEEKPIADNDTSAGRAKNCRVKFVLSHLELIIKELSLQ
jgi:outer membrane protein OmpA-like peptidoglycan-associated protein